MVYDSLLLGYLHYLPLLIGLLDRRGIRYQCLDTKVYCVCLNITYNELINSNRYRYLYMPEKVRSGKLYLIWKPRMA
jgi:hypothetical protein